MNWRYIVCGPHTRIRVFMNGAGCGTLCLRNEEFEEFRMTMARLGTSYIQFIDETPQATGKGPVS